MAKNKPEKKRGRISDEEARLIEMKLPFSSYEDVANELGRDASTIRKFAQRNGIAKDKISSQKFVANEIKKDPIFKKLEDYLNEDELVKAHSIYSEFLQQFGSDILFSEQQEIIDFSIVSCLIDRDLIAQKKIENELEEAVKKIAELEHIKKEVMDDPEDEDYDRIVDELDDLNIAVADLKEERKQNRDSYKHHMDRKEKLTKSLHGSRTQRANDLINATENLGTLIARIQGDPDIRKEWGMDMAKMRLAMHEEALSLSTAFKYADSEICYPLLNSETVERELEKNAEEN